MYITTGVASSAHLSTNLIKARESDINIHTYIHCKSTLNKIITSFHNKTTGRILNVNSIFALK